MWRHLGESKARVVVWNYCINTDETKDIKNMEKNTVLYAIPPFHPCKDYLSLPPDAEKIICFNLN